MQMHHGLPPRITDDIDLVVQPTSLINAESISAWLLSTYPTDFKAKMVHGVPVPTLLFRRSDGSIKQVEIEIFDVDDWPQRPQYNLDNPDNDITVIDMSGIQTPVFSARWLFREKVVTAFERQGSRKEETDLDDARDLLPFIEPKGMDLSKHEDAV